MKKTLATLALALLLAGCSARFQSTPQHPFPEMRDPVTQEVPDVTPHNPSHKIWK